MSSSLDSQRRQQQQQQQQQHEGSLKLRWQESQKNNLYSKLVLSGTTASNDDVNNNPKKMQIFPGGFDDDLVVSAVVPPVTVVLEGRSICQRISLDKHTSYQSLAKALRQMFVDVNDDGCNNGVTSNSDGGELDLSNAIPGHLIAYEDMENDLLLVGDLKWNDFVRVAKRIRILPIKANSRNRRVES